MNNFDSAIDLFITRHAFTSPIVNGLIHLMTNIYLAKGLPLLAVLWAVWFHKGEDIIRRREIVIITLVSAFVSIAVGRELADLLPFRLRPCYDASLQLHFPVIEKPNMLLRTWSSFPSDHAMLWTAVASGIFIVWRKTGTIAILFTILFIDFPRVYTGLHYPTDVIAGALIGAFITFLLSRRPLRSVIATPVINAFERNPGLCYGLAFLLTFEMASQLDELRLISHLFFFKVI